jgi:hypothetical protein
MSNRWIGALVALLITTAPPALAQAGWSAPHRLPGSPDLELAKFALDSENSSYLVTSLDSDAPMAHAISTYARAGGSGRYRVIRTPLGAGADARNINALHSTGRSSLAYELIGDGTHAVIVRSVRSGGHLGPAHFLSDFDLAAATADEHAQAVLVQDSQQTPAAVLRRRAGRMSWQTDYLPATGTNAKMELDGQGNAWILSVDAKDDGQPRGPAYLELVQCPLTRECEPARIIGRGTRTTTPGGRDDDTPDVSVSFVNPTITRDLDGVLVTWLVAGGLRYVRTRDGNIVASGWVTRRKGLPSWVPVTSATGRAAIVLPVGPSVLLTTRTARGTWSRLREIPHAETYPGDADAALNAAGDLFLVTDRPRAGAYLQALTRVPPRGRATTVLQPATTGNGAFILLHSGRRASVFTSRNGNAFGRETLNEIREFRP